MKIFVRILRFLLCPFSVLYGFVTYIRNLLYDKNILKSFNIPGKSIVIGNINTGGTGKSPHVIYLAKKFESTEKIAVLSRGYGRKSTGFFEVAINDEVSKVGDEPLMIKNRLSAESKVYVCESRKQGVLNILDKIKNPLIILDDAFQHRKVTSNCNVLLTDYNLTFANDYMLPTGNLREWSVGKNRAKCVVVTKCPINLTSEEKQSIISKLKFVGPVYFSKIVYGECISFGRITEATENAILVSGIANPAPLEKFLAQESKVLSFNFPDHHNFNAHDLVKIHAKFDTFAKEKCKIVTTEKDFIKINKLLSAQDKLKYPWYYQSIEVKIDKEEEFIHLINKYVNSI